MIKEFKLEQFSGPLDLLLNLIEQQKLDISELSLSEVTEQYLEYLEKLEEKNPEELADFLLIAARLLLLKSRKLLPQLASEEEQGPSLEEQLRLYQVFRQASRKINKKWMSKKYSAFRIEPLRRPVEFTAPKNLGLDKLHGFMVKLVNRLKPLFELPQTTIDRAVTMREKVEQIRKMLTGKKTASFNEFLNTSKNRTEVVVGFLALLELVREHSIVLHQKGIFNDIMIERI